MTKNQQPAAARAFYKWAWAWRSKHDSHGTKLNGPNPFAVHQSQPISTPTLATTWPNIGLSCKSVHSKSLHLENIFSNSGILLPTVTVVLIKDLDSKNGGLRFKPRWGHMEIYTRIYNLTVLSFKKKSSLLASKTMWKCNWKMQPIP